MTSRRLTTAAAAATLAAGALLAAAAPAQAVPDLVVPTQDAGASGAVGEPFTDQELLSDLAAAAAVTDDYWSRHLPSDLGRAYYPPALASGADGVPGLYDGRTDELACGGSVLPVGNAVYCGGPQGHWIAADLTLLRTAQSLGDAFVYVVLAHEWGHAVQAHLAAEELWPARELQADCFSGAALQGAVDEGALLLEPADDQEVYDSYAALDDTPWGEGGSHGSAEERYAAFARGVQDGPVGCLAR